MQLVVAVALMEVKHFLADFIFQTDRHIGKFRKVGWVLSLADHCSIHGLFTLAIVFALRPDLWWLAVLDFVIHFIMDRIKASPDLLGRFKALDGEGYKMCQQDVDSPDPCEVSYAQNCLRSNKLFWWSLGLDQLIHQFTGLYIAYRLTL